MNYSLRRLLSHSVSTLALLFPLASLAQEAAPTIEVVPWDEHCVVTAPEGRYVQFNARQPVLRASARGGQHVVTYSYAVGSTELCNGSELCFSAEEQHQISFTLNFDESWQPFLSQNERNSWISVGLYEIPGHRPNEYTLYANWGEGSPWGAEKDGAVNVLIDTTYNVCENLRLIYRETDDAEYCDACHGYDHTELSTSYEGSGEFRVVTSYTETKGIMEERKIGCGVLQGSGVSASVGLILGFALLVLARKGAVGSPA